MKTNELAKEIIKKVFGKRKQETLKRLIGEQSELVEALNYMDYLFHEDPNLKAMKSLGEPKEVRAKTITLLKESDKYNNLDEVFINLYNTNNNKLNDIPTRGVL